MKSPALLNRKYVNRRFVFNPLDIVNDNCWISGDYLPQYQCDCWDYYHICYTNRRLGFDVVLEQARDNERYERVYSEIRDNGFLKPLSAIVSPDWQALVLVDGHHRLASALDLNINKIPIYVAKPRTPLEDLVADDSAVWAGHMV